MHNLMVSHRCAITNRYANKHADNKRTLEFLHHPRFTYQDVFEHLENTKSLGDIQGKILVHLDTSKLNLAHNAGRLRMKDPHIGVLSRDDTVGMFFHVALIQSGNDYNQPLRLGALKCFARPFHQRRTRVSRTPIDDRETSLWANSMHEVVRRTSGASQRVFVSDRGSDSYYYLSECTQSMQDYVVRAKTDRRLGSKQTSLFKRARSIGGTGVEIRVRVDGKKRPARIAQLSLKATSLTIPKPEVRDATIAPPVLPQVHVAVVHAVELSETVPAGRQPLEWILLTSLPIQTAEQIEEVVKIYASRWKIEELFKTVKSDVMKMEDTQLSTGHSIQKQLTLALDVGAKIMSMKEHRDNEQADASILFDSVEIEVLEASLEECEGKTQKQKNPYRHLSLAWAIWIIARLGMWKGVYQSGPKIGVKTLKCGFDKLQERKTAWMLYQKRANQERDYTKLPP